MNRRLTAVEVIRESRVAIEMLPHAIGISRGGSDVDVYTGAKLGQERLGPLPSIVDRPSDRKTVEIIVTKRLICSAGNEEPDRLDLVAPCRDVQRRHTEHAAESRLA